MQQEIDRIFKVIEAGVEGSITDMVGSSSDVTYALNPAGEIWSTRYKDLGSKKRKARV
jgi:hypothetical protein